MQVEKQFVQDPTELALTKLGYSKITSKDKKDILHYETFKTALSQLNQNITTAHIDKFYNELNMHTNQTFTKSKELYEKITLNSMIYTVSDFNYSLKLIDYIDITNNSFNYIREHQIYSNINKYNQTDFTLFVNGIPFCIIECKRNDLEAGAKQLNRYADEFSSLFNFTPFNISLTATSMKYGTPSSPLSFYLTWKEKQEGSTLIEQNLKNLIEPKRLLNIYKNYIIYDESNNKKIKKIARYQQYRAVELTLKRLLEGSGGLIWHTTGSGKSLTMGMIIKKVKNSSLKNNRFIIVCDRVELDTQIANTIKNSSGEIAINAKSSEHLQTLLKDNSVYVTFTTLAKFGSIKQKYDSDFIVLIDEAHRSQSGEDGKGGLFHSKLKQTLPNGKFIGFTGTPLLADELRNSRELFGDYIDKYLLKDATSDGAVLPISYENRVVPLELTGDVDNMLLAYKKENNLSSEVYEKIKKRFSTKNRLLSVSSRIDFIVNDIAYYYSNNIKDSTFKAMIATSSTHDAINYYNRIKKVEIETYISFINDSEESNKFWSELLETTKYNTVVEYTANAKEEFKKDGGDIKLFIVVNQMLTGYDAPSLKYLFIDKELKTHNMLQAIARTNRVNSGKERGIVVDYRGLYVELRKALQLYNGEDDDTTKEIEEVLNCGDIKMKTEELKTKIANVKKMYNGLSDVNDIVFYLTNLELKGKEKIIDTFNNLAYSALNCYKDLKIIDEFDESGYINDIKKIYVILQLLKKSNISNVNEHDKNIINILDSVIDIDSNNIDKYSVNNILDIDKSKDEKLELYELLMQDYDKSIEIKNSEPSKYDLMQELIKKTLNRYNEEKENIKDLFNKYIKEKDDIERKNSINRVFDDNILENLYKKLKTLNSGKNKNELQNIAKEIDEFMKNKIKADWYNLPNTKKDIIYKISDLLYDGDDDRAKRFFDNMLEFFKESYPWN